MSKHGRPKGVTYEVPMRLRLKGEMYRQLQEMARDQESNASAMVRLAIRHEIAEWVREMENGENVAV